MDMTIPSKGIRVCSVAAIFTGSADKLSAAAVVATVVAAVVPDAKNKLYHYSMMEQTTQIMQESSKIINPALQVRRPPRAAETSLSGEFSFVFFFIISSLSLFLE